MAEKLKIISDYKSEENVNNIGRHAYNDSFENSGRLDVWEKYVLEKKII
jgi:hypothetical protein